MRTQQIFGVSGGGMLFSGKSASVKCGDNGFEQLMQMSQNTTQTKEISPAETKKESSVVTKSEQQTKPSEVLTEKKETNTTTEKEPELKKAETKNTASDTEAVERLAGVLNRVVEAVKEMLNLSDEELELFMQQLGISSVELIQPETLQNLVLMANSEQDAVVLITDSQLLNSVNELSKEVEQLLSEAGVTREEILGITDAPEFKKLLESTAEAGQKEEKTDANESVEAESTASVADSKETADVKVEIHVEDKESYNSSKNGNEKQTAKNEDFSVPFFQNLQKAAEHISEATGQKDIVQMVREVAEQILEKIRVSVTAETTSMEIVLTPEELGKVNLTVSSEQDGALKAKFVTENEIAKEAIECNLIQFKEMLKEQGLKVETIEVMVANFEFDKNGQAGEDSKEERRNGNRRLLNDEELGKKDDNDQLLRVFLEAGESTVSFTA